MQIAIQGAEGSFHHEAALHLFPDAQVLPCDTFDEVFEAVAHENAQHGLTAIENTLHGSINEVYRLLERHDVWITHAIRMHITQQLIGQAGVTLDDLAMDPETRVFSQAPALAQVEQWLKKNLPDAHREETQDTARSVADVLQMPGSHNVAVAGSFAAETYGGNIIAESIHDDPDNFTRFVLFQKERVEVPGAEQASVIIKTDHAPGALYEILKIFKRRGSNLTKLDSHPIPSDKRHYAFYIDFEHPEKGTTAALLKKIAAAGNDVKLLGEYVSVDA